MGRVRLMPGRKWGGVARRGAGKIDPDKPPPRGRGGHKPPPRDRKEPKELGPPPAWEPEQWIEEPDAEAKPLRKAATKAVDRGGQRPRRTAPADVAEDIGAKVPRALAAHVEQRLMEAAKAFERERYKD